MCAAGLTLRARHRSREREHLGHGTAAISNEPPRGDVVGPRTADRALRRDRPTERLVFHWYRAPSSRRRASARSVADDRAGERLRPRRVRGVDAGPSNEMEVGESGWKSVTCSVCTHAPWQRPAYSNETSKAASPNAHTPEPSSAFSKFCSHVPLLVARANALKLSPALVVVLAIGAHDDRTRRFHQIRRRKRCVWHRSEAMRPSRRPRSCSRRALSACSSSSLPLRLCAATS